jgi:hypothetical protein
VASLLKWQGSSIRTKAVRDDYRLSRFFAFSQANTGKAIRNNGTRHSADYFSALRGT